MAHNMETMPMYKSVMRKGILYYRTHFLDADGKRVDLYARTREDLFQKEKEARKKVEEALFRKENPTVKEYSEKWLAMQSTKIRKSTLNRYTSQVNNYIIKPLGDRYMADVTQDDIRLALIPASKKSASLYSSINMLVKCIFYSAEYSNLINENPTAGISAKGGTPSKGKDALTDVQVKKLLSAIEGLPPQLFVMIALYSGLRREEILALQWDCVHIDQGTPYISVRRSWHSENNRPIITTDLKTAAARRDIPIPRCLVDILRTARESSISDFVIADRDGNPLSYSQFRRVWKYIEVRTAKERTYYRYVNGQKIIHTVKPILGDCAYHNANVVYSLDFDVTPHQLRHTYITNLIYASVDPKTVQYLAGHKNSKITMDIYAKVKYNKPTELLPVVNAAFSKE